MLEVRFGLLKPTYDTRVLHFEAALAKRSIRSGKLKAEEQRIERLRIGREKDKTRRITKKLQEEYKRSSETEDYEKQRLATLKRLKQGDENELERKLRLEKVVTNEHLRLAVEKEDERRMLQLPNG